MASTYGASWMVVRIAMVEAEAEATVKEAGVDNCCIPGINVADAAVADREAMAKVEVTIS